MAQAATTAESPRVKTKEVAKLLKVSEAQVRRLVRKGEIKPIAGGGQGSDLFFNREEMEVYAAGGKEALDAFLAERGQPRQ